MATVLLLDPEPGKEPFRSTIIEELADRILELQWQGMGYPSPLREMQELKELQKEYDLLTDSVLARAATH